MKWDVGFKTATAVGGTVNSNHVIADDKKSITITCDIGTSTASETCIVNAVIANNSTFDVQLESNPTITYDSTYVKSVDAIWLEDSKNIAASDTIDAESTKEIKISIVTNELSSDMLSSTSLTVPITISMNWVETEDKSLKILSIGNSFSVDSQQYLYQIAENLGYEDITLGNLYIGGCSLATHLSNAQNDSASYTYYTNTSGEWITTNSYKISTAVQSEDWDYITFQQASPNSGQADTYDDLDKLIDIVEPMSPDSKLVWHMTWAYQQDSTHTGFANYNNNQIIMYNSIINSVQNKIKTNDKIDIILPVGTAIQNARTSSLGDTLTRDGYHMSYNEGRYIAGVSFLRSLTGININSLTYKPSDVSEQVRKIAIESANNAHSKPYTITQSSYVSIDGYERANLELVKSSFYNTAPTTYATPPNLTDYTNNKDGNHQFFWATQVFSKETLPIGTKIIIADGWQYRPDGWTIGEDGSYTGSSSTSTRPANVTTKEIIIDEEWWGDYTHRGFNISIIGSTIDISVLKEDQINSVIQIYIPIENEDDEELERVTLNLTSSSFYNTNSSAYATPPNLTDYTNNKAGNHQFFWQLKYLRKKPYQLVLRLW